MDEGRWGTAVKPSAGCSWRIQRPNMQWDQEQWWNLINLHGFTIKCSQGPGSKMVLLTFGGECKITGKGTIRTSKLNFENVYYVEELQNFNVFSVSQICDTKNKVLFTDKECLVLSKEFQLPENNQLAKHGLVNGLPSKLFTNEHNCVACNKGKQHKASYKAITAVSTISTLQLLHMDLFGPTSIRSIDHKHYSLVVTDDFSWVVSADGVTDGPTVPFYSVCTAFHTDATSLPLILGDLTSLFKTRCYARGDDKQFVNQRSDGNFTIGTKWIQKTKECQRVVKALYGLHQAPRAWYARLSTFLLKHNYIRGTIDKTLFIKKNSKDIILVQVYVDDIIFRSTNKAWCTEFEVLMKGEFEMSAIGELTFFLSLLVKQQPDGIFISQDKYVQDMLRRFDMDSMRPATTPYEALRLKSRMNRECALFRHQVTPLTSNLNAVKKIFKYLKGQPKLGLWYPRDSPFVLEAYSDSDYAGSMVVRKSTTGGCQFGRTIDFHAVPMQTVVGNLPSTEAEYVAAAHCYGQSTICIVKNPVFHQRTKHIEIRHHFIRDANEKNLIQVLKIHTDDNVADLLTKAFDGPRFHYLRKYRLSSGPPAIVATIDGTPFTITESLMRSKLQLHDEGGIVDMPILDIYLGMDNLGYPTEAGTSGEVVLPNPQTDHAPITEPRHQPASPHDHGSTSPRPTPHIPAAQMNESHRGSKMKSKLKARGRNVILSESDNEEDEEQDVDSLIKLAKAAAFASDTSYVPTAATKATAFPPSSSIPTDAFDHGSDVPTEDPPITERSFRQMEEDRLGAEVYYNDADWSDIMGQVHANTGLTADLLGPDVNEDNFAARMAAIIAERRRKFAAQRFQDKINKPMTYAQQRDYMRTFVKNQSSTIYTTGWTLKHVRSFSDEQLKDEFDKIRHALDNLHAQNLRRSLKRPGADVEQPGSKKSKSSAAPQTPVPAASHQSSAGVTPGVHQSPFVDTPPVTPPHSPKVSSHPDVTPDTSVDPTVAPTPPFATPVVRTSGPRTRSQSIDADIKIYSTRRKSLAPRKMPSSDVDLNAPDTSFIHVLSDDDSDDSAGDTNTHYWHAFAAWEIVPTGLGDVNALYFTDKSSKFFTHLREILHLLDRQDLSKLYGMVVKHYEVTPLAGNGLILWGDLRVLFNSTSGGTDIQEQSSFDAAFFLLLIRRLMTIAFGAGFQDVAVQSSGDFNERSIKDL
ncbi:putative ribonuclease H-like domain-containing protein [Tanacetum coccineum]